MIDGPGPLVPSVDQPGSRDGLATAAWLATTAAILGAASILLSRILPYLI